MSVDVEVFDYNRMVLVLGLLADPTRLRILLAIADRGEMSVGEIKGLDGGMPTSVSGHLSLFALSGILSGNRRGQNVFYSLNPGVIEMLEYMDNFARRDR